MQFMSLLGSHQHYITVALSKKGGGTGEVELFVTNLLFWMRFCQHAALKCLPPSDRAVAEMRLDGALTHLTLLLESYASVPVERLISTTHRRLYNGPWVPLLSRLEVFSSDVGMLIDLHPESEHVKVPRRRRPKQEVLDQIVGDYIQMEEAAGVPFVHLTRDGIAEAVDLVGDWVSKTNPWKALARRKRSAKARPSRPDAAASVVDIAIDNLTRGEQPLAPDWDAIERDQERDARFPNRHQ